jgi:hypothetical protein
MSSLVSFIAAMPKLIEWMKKLISWISLEIEAAKRKKLGEDLNQAVDQSKKSKNTSEIDQLFDSGSK